MKKILKIVPVLALGACIYNNPVNNEKFFSNADITKVDWSKVDGKGSSCQTNWFFGLVPFGDNSVASAVQIAEISKIAYVSTDVVLYLPLLMTRECTNVWGELTPSARSSLAMFDNFEDERPRPAPRSTPARAAAPAASEARSDYDFPVGE